MIDKTRFKPLYIDTSACEMTPPAHQSHPRFVGGPGLSRVSIDTSVFEQTSHVLQSGYESPVSPVHKRPSHDTTPTPLKRKRSSLYADSFDDVLAITHLLGKGYHGASSSIELECVHGADAAKARKSSCIIRRDSVREALLSLWDERPDEEEITLVEKPHRNRSLTGVVIFEGFVVLSDDIRDGDISAVSDASDSYSQWLTVSYADMSTPEINHQLVFPNPSNSLEPSMTITVALEQDLKLLRAQSILRDVYGLSADEISLLLSFLCVSYCCKIKLTTDAECEDLCYVNLYFSDL